MAEPTGISPSLAAVDMSDISSEREQLLIHSRHTRERKAHALMGTDESSAPCQVCGRDDGDVASSQSYGKIDRFSPWFPETDPDDPRAQTWSKKMSRQGTALFIQIFISTTILMFNIWMTTYAMAKYGVLNGLGDIYQGDCMLVGRYNTLVHSGINIVSTLLLSSSNYCAQLLAAPTRSEVDTAHHNGEWLDIGVPSLRNLWKKRIAGKRKAAWTLLMISSVLLHFVWNSAVFAAKPSSLYHIAVVTSDYLADAGQWPTHDNQTLHMLQNTESLSHLNRTQCIERYISSTPGQKDVLVVAANITMREKASLEGGASNSSLLYDLASFDNGPSWIWAETWLCSAFDQGPDSRPQSWCTADSLLSKEAEWTLKRYTTNSNGTVDKSLWVKVDYCLSAGVESLDGFCALRFSAEILLMVCILNLGKCAAIYYTAYLHYRSDKTSKEKASLVTIGDAVASFLSEKDPATENLPFASREDFTRKEWPSKRSPLSHPGPSLYRIRWFKAASYIQWLVMLTLWFTVSIIVAVLLAKGIDAERRRGIAVDVKSLIAQGLGTPQPYAAGLTGLTRRMGRVAGFYFTVFFANMWQVIYSGIYLVYNGLLTTMVVADEWNGFIKERQTLRLSSPHGIQRSSYFLSLPYRFAVPLIIVSGTLQWLISQSVFVVQTIGMAYGDSFYRYPVYDSSMIGYSNIGTIYCLIIGSVMVVALVMLGLCNSYRPRKYNEERKPHAQSYTMPLVSTCSAAISAACHRPDDDSESHLLPVRWGFVCGDYWCFTTSRHVSYPALGPDTESRMLAKTSGGEGHLQVDLGPAFEILNPSNDISSSEHLKVGEQRRESEDTRALLPRSQPRV